MAAFAHFAGFHEDRRSVLHFHPKGPPVRNEKARGGPDLEFIFFAPQPGFVRLFAQVRIDGVPKFAPFTVSVKVAPPAWANEGLRVVTLSPPRIGSETVLDVR